ncbi:hypothetical protein J2S74_002043 [Evansella vedderi]|uniref:Gluconate 2-dehydrogenase subunit 3 family protein n=1 Tax=Evansella vedderi TaxID=38282 RepID=A0ABT9ZUW8_9BACI|nr:gluconate 2-dehydrogenase subunit 3 family protein [Evansella vedderi]MDQ0254664.1 hypothetical protein [Evansella vedderi]
MNERKAGIKYRRVRPLDGRLLVGYSVNDWKAVKGRKVSIYPRFKETELFVSTIKAAVDTMFPDARKGRVDHYIIESLQTVYRRELSVYEEGVRRLNQLANSMYSKAFHQLGEKGRTRILEKLEETEFFYTLRQHTMEGMFADPKYGGNRNMVGWRLIGFPGAQFHPITHTSRGWKTPGSVSLKGERVRDGNNNLFRR